MDDPSQLPYPCNHAIGRTGRPSGAGHLRRIGSLLELPTGSQEAGRTATGTCQICGRSQKIVRGVIAHHGYRQPWRSVGSGARTSSCPGSRRLPYEVSRDAIPPVRANYEEQRLNCIAGAEALVSSPPETFTIPKKFAGYPTGETIVLTRPATFDAEANYRQGAYRLMCYEGEHAGRLRTLRTHARMIAESIQFLDDRYAAWKAVAA